MKVSELVAELLAIPQDAEIAVVGTDPDGYDPTLGDAAGLFRITWEGEISYTLTGLDNSYIQSAAIMFRGGGLRYDVSAEVFLVSIIGGKKVKGGEV